MLKLYFDAFRAFFRDEDGASAVEYGLIVGLIAVVLIAVLLLTGTGLQGLFQSVANCVTSPSTCGGGGGGGGG